MREKGNRSDSGVRPMFSGLTAQTYFEIRVFCEAQNRDERPWLESISQRLTFLPQNRKWNLKIMIFIYQLIEGREPDGT